MIEPVSKTIGLNEYVYRPLTATPAYKLLVKLIKIIGPSFASLASGGPDKFGAAANILAQNLDERSAEDIIKLLVGQSDVRRGDVGDSTYQALRLVFEMHFAKAMGEMFEFIAFALEAQFGDFIGAVLSAQKRVMPGTATTSTEPKLAA